MEDTDVVAVKHSCGVGDSPVAGDYFVTANENNIRPYGILFKKM